MRVLHFCERPHATNVIRITMEFSHRTTVFFRRKSKRILPLSINDCHQVRSPVDDLVDWRTHRSLCVGVHNNNKLKFVFCLESIYVQLRIWRLTEMPPNQTLTYENEDAELVPSYEKKGKHNSQWRWWQRVWCELQNCTNLLFHWIYYYHTSTTILGYRTTPLFWINGQRVAVKLASQARPNQTLLSFLRDTMGLTGSKLGCAEGGCGACTVMVSKLDKESKTIK